MKQRVLIDRVISAVGIDDGTNEGKYTPDGSLSLVNNQDGFPDSGSFKYSRFVEILPYLSGHTRPDILFAVMYGHAMPADPTCVKSHTSYVIKFSYCPGLCKSKLQTEISLLDMEK